MEQALALLARAPSAHAHENCNLMRCSNPCMIQLEPACSGYEVPGQGAHVVKQIVMQRSMPPEGVCAPERPVPGTALPAASNCMSDMLSQLSTRANNLQASSKTKSQAAL